MKALGFESLIDDSAVYRQATTRVLVISYMNDVLIIATNDQRVISLKGGLEEQGIEVEWAAPGPGTWYWA